MVKMYISRKLHICIMKKKMYAFNVHRPLSFLTVGRFYPYLSPFTINRKQKSIVQVNIRRNNFYTLHIDSYMYINEIRTRADF